MATLRRVSSTDSKSITTADGYVLTEELWTPEDAQALLDQTDATKNRRTRPTAVDSYKRDMEEGRWGFCDTPIVITPEGDIIQGKHRMTALAQADCPQGVRFFVIRGVPADKIHTFDTGAKRTPGDQLKLQGVNDYSRAASVASILYRWERSDTKFRRWESAQRPSTAEIVETYHANAEAIQRAIAGTRLSALHKTDLTPAVAAFAWMLFEPIDPQVCAEFFSTLVNRDLRHLPENKVLDTLWVALHGEDKNKKGNIAEMNPRAMLALVVKAWNKWATGNGGDITNLRFSSKIEQFPKVAA